MDSHIHDLSRHSSVENESHTHEGKAALFRNALSSEQRQKFFANEGVDPLTQAFDAKLAIHAGFGGTPVPEERRAEVLAGLMAHPRKGKTAAYIHVPFCETHCLYCGFYNRAYRSGESARYTGALLRELAMWREAAPSDTAPIHAVYFGGGTPTALEATDLRRLVRGVRDALPLANDCEITVEGRIHNFSPEKMDACLDAGANRFSLGVQTFNTELRRSMRRIADRDTIIESLSRLRDQDQAAVIIDLIYGFPGQSLNDWRKDIEQFLALDLHGVDLYQLNVFRGSPLHDAIEKGDMPPAANIPQQAAMFVEGGRIMQEAHYRRLSASHWGRDTRERNIYNHMMKGPSHCLPFGPGAGGNLFGHFHFVKSDYEGWHEAIACGQKPIDMLVGPAPNAKLDKTLAAAFELCRVNLARIGKDFGLPLASIVSPLTEQWERAGLVSCRNGWLELTTAGEFWQVTMAQLMIDYLHLSSEEEKAS